jgi:large subunit ribosomal protein L15
MINLSNLQNTHRPRKKVQRVGRGIGSKRGKTACRGGKGYSARSGSKVRLGYEGGQLPLYRKLPRRGFGNGMFRKNTHAINLSLIELLFNDGEVVNLFTLREKGHGYAPKDIVGGLKILSNGSITKKVIIQANEFSKGAIAKLDEANISYEIISKSELI